MSNQSRGLYRSVTEKKKKSTKERQNDVGYHCPGIQRQFYIHISYFMALYSGTAVSYVVSQFGKPHLSEK